MFRTNRNILIAMRKIGIFYGSTTGVTENVADIIARKLEIPQADVHDVANISAEQVAPYTLLILGSSTWGAGELQDDWYNAVEVLKKCDLSSKEIALFGCGDSESYCDTFCDAIGILRNELKGCGAEFKGDRVDVSGYTFSSSLAVTEEGYFAGLPLDEVNEPDKTETRIENWLKEIIS